MLAGADGSPWDLAPSTSSVSLAGESASGNLSRGMRQFMPCLILRRPNQSRLGATAIEHSQHCAASAQALDAIGKSIHYPLYRVAWTVAASA